MADEFAASRDVAAAEAELRERHGALEFDLDMARHYLRLAHDRAEAQATCGIVVVDEAMEALRAQLAGQLAVLEASVTLARLAASQRLAAPKPTQGGGAT